MTEMKEYFFLKHKDQTGPFTIEQLADKGLTNETLIWTDGMENWTKLKDIPELAQTLKLKSVPPPPPSETDEKISRTEVSGQLKVTTEKTPNAALEVIKPSRTILTWLMIWSVFHLFALLMSYSEIEFFTKGIGPKTEQFWPFSENINHCDDPKWEKISKQYENGWYKYCFGGLFRDYDWTEFAFYVGGAIVIYLLVRISNKDEEKKMHNIN